MTATQATPKLWGASWTPNYDTVLARLAPDCGFKAAGAAIGVSANAARSRAKVIGVQSGLKRGGSQQRPKTTWRRIIGQCAEEAGLSYADVCGRDRRVKIVVARQKAWWRIRHEIGFSYPHIGMLFGFDHSTVMNGVQRHGMRLAGLL